MIIEENDQHIQTVLCKHSFEYVVWRERLMDLHELKFFSMGSALQEDSSSLVLNMRYCCILCN